MAETCDLSNPRDIWIVGVDWQGRMGLCSWDAPAGWKTEYALVLGLAPGISIPLASAALAKLGAVCERLPEGTRYDIREARAEAARRSAHLVLCYWKPDEQRAKDSP